MIENRTCSLAARQYDRKLLLGHRCRKEPVFGGTTALSGGGIWIPDNALARHTVHSDTIDAKFVVDGEGKIVGLHHNAFVEFRSKAGRDLTDLYITSACEGLAESELHAYPHSGALFIHRPAVAGQPTNSYGG